MKSQKQVVPVAHCLPLCHMHGAAISFAASHGSPGRPLWRLACGFLHTMLNRFLSQDPVCHRLGTAVCRTTKRQENAAATAFSMKRMLRVLSLSRARLGVGRNLELIFMEQFGSLGCLQCFTSLACV